MIVETLILGIYAVAIFLFGSHIGRITYVCPCRNDLEGDHDMMSPKRLEEMKAAIDMVDALPPGLRITPEESRTFFFMLKDAIAEIEELQKRNRMLQDLIGGTEK